MFLRENPAAAYLTGQAHVARCRVKKNYFPGNYSADSATATISPAKVVFTEAAVDTTLNVQEAQWVQSLATQQTTRPQIGAIVAFVPLEDGSKVESVVKEVRALALAALCSHCGD